MRIGIRIDKSFFTVKSGKCNSIAIPYEINNIVKYFYLFG